VQGWESGRRRLLATRIEIWLDVRRELAEAGAAPEVLAALEPAMEADLLLGRRLAAEEALHLTAWQGTEAQTLSVQGSGPRSCVDTRGH